MLRTDCLTLAPRLTQSETRQMKIFLFFAGICLSISAIQAQNIGINETGAAPHPSAMVDIESLDKGILIPRLADHTTIAAPAQGLLVYNSTDNGFWYWDGTQWLPLLGGNAGWQILGNNGIDPAINYIGTNDAAALLVRVNNTPAGRIDWNAVTTGSALGQKGATALGFEALSSNTTGYQNTALGYGAGSSVTTGFNNTIFGYNAANSLSTSSTNVVMGSQAAASMTSSLRNVLIGADVALNTVDGGEDNVLIGERTGLNFEEGNRNILIGNLTGINLASSSDNIFLGYRTGQFTNTSTQNIFVGNRAGGNGIQNSSFNIFIGNEAGFSNSTGERNVFLGTAAGRSMTTGDRNVFIGENAGTGKTTASWNVAIGWSAMDQPQVGVNEAYQSVAVGYRAGSYCGSAGNVFIGFESGHFASLSPENTFVGSLAGKGLGIANFQRPGARNTFIGFQAGTRCIQGCDENTFLGTRAGENTTVGSGNVYIGYSAGNDFPGNISNRIAIANGPDSSDVLIYGEFVTNRVGINTVEPTQTFSVDGDAGKNGGGMWLTFSDRRVKDQIAEFSEGLDVVLKLNPVTYRYNEMSGYKDTQKEYVGFIAQDVEEVAPYMVTLYDDSKGASGLKDKRVLDTSALNQLFVNSFKEQQKEIETLENRVAQLEQLVQQLLDSPSAVAEK